MPKNVLVLQGNHVPFTVKGGGGAGDCIRAKKYPNRFCNALGINSFWLHGDELARQLFITVKLQNKHENAKDSSP